jgi:hypothetical protein
MYLNPDLEFHVNMDLCDHPIHPRAQGGGQYVSLILGNQK